MKTNQTRLRGRSDRFEGGGGRLFLDPSNRHTDNHIATLCSVGIFVLKHYFTESFQMKTINQFSMVLQLALQSRRTFSFFFIFKEGNNTCKIASPGLNPGTLSFI